MRRMLMPVLLAMGLLATSLLPAGRAQAQATTDQLNRLSLEALTTPAPGGNPGPRYGGYGRASYRGSYHRSYRRPGRRSYGRPAYHRSARRYAPAPRHHAYHVPRRAPRRY